MHECEKTCVAFSAQKTISLNSARMFAIVIGHEHVATKLINAGPSLDQRNNRGGEALICAITKGMKKSSKTH